MDELDLPESPFPAVRSVVVRADPPREPRPRKRRDKTPESLGSPESIVLEEPPKKKQQSEELLQDLACTPSISLSSVSLSGEDSETDVEMDTSKKQDKHNKKAEKGTDNDQPKQLKTITNKPQTMRKSTVSARNIDTVQKTEKGMTGMEDTMGRDKKCENREKGGKVVKENDKRWSREEEKVVEKDKVKHKDNVKEKRNSLSKDGQKRHEKVGEKRNEIEGVGSSSCKTMKEKDKQKETEKNKTNHTEGKSEKRKETKTEMSKGIEKMKSNDKRIESKVGQECTKETDSEQITITEITNKAVEVNEESEDGVTEKMIGKESEVSIKHIKLMKSGDVEEEYEIDTEKWIESDISEVTVNEKENEMEKKLAVVKEVVNEIKTPELETVENINKPEETGSIEIDNAEKKEENEYGKNNNINKINTEEIMDISDKNETDKQGERNDKMSDKHTDLQDTNIDKNQIKGQYSEHAKATVDNQSERTKGTNELKQIEETEKRKLERKEMKQKASKIKRMGRKDRKIVVRVNYQKSEIRVK